MTEATLTRYTKRVGLGGIEVKVPGCLKGS